MTTPVCFVGVFAFPLFICGTDVVPLVAVFWPPVDTEVAVDCSHDSAAEL